MDIRSNFYHALRDDFLNNPRKSFLFDLHLNKRLENGTDFSREPMEELFDRLIDPKRTYKLKLNSEDRHWIWELGERAGGAKLRAKLEELDKALQDTEDGVKKRDTTTDKEQYRQIWAVLKGHSELVTGDELNKLRKIVLDATVIQDAAVFLYNAGFPLNNETKANPRKADRTFALMEAWDTWCEERGLPSMFRQETYSSGPLTGEEREDWKEMDRLLRTLENPPKLILPVMFDARTGVGLYLVSTEYLNLQGEDIPRKAQMEMEKEKKRLKYVYTCLGGFDILCQDLDYIYKKCVKKSKKATINDLFYGFSLMMQPFEDYPSFELTLQAGEQMFSHILGGISVYNFFREDNNITPRGTPQRFWRYFRSMEQEDMKTLAMEGHQALAPDI